MGVEDVPLIDVSPLFGPHLAERDSVDLQVIRAITTIGVMTITGLPTDIRVDAPSRHRILRPFHAPRAVIEGLAGNTRDPWRLLVYHGWFPPESRCIFWSDAFQIGADVVRGDDTVDPHDPLASPTPMPAEAVIPGWREAVQAHFLGMERVATGVLQSIARGLGLSGDRFTSAFMGGASSMRLLRYPLRPANANPTCALVGHDSDACSSTNRISILVA